MYDSNIHACMFTTSSYQSTQQYFSVFPCWLLHTRGKEGTRAKHLLLAAAAHCRHVRQGSIFLLHLLRCHFFGWCLLRFNYGGRWPTPRHREDADAGPAIGLSAIFSLRGPNFVCQRGPQGPIPGGAADLHRWKPDEIRAVRGQRIRHGHLEAIQLS